MSYLAFTTREGEARVRGWERHRLTGICRDFGTGMLALRAGSPSLDTLDELTPAGSGAKHTGREFGWGHDMARLFSLYLGHEDFLEYQGHGISSFPLLLNTVLELGSDPFRLAARFAGQSYSHCWIPGADRAWAADLIEEGLTTDVFRHKIRFRDENDPVEPGWQEDRSGWTEVISLLRAEYRGAVVLYVSTGDDFPDHSLLGVPADAAHDVVWDRAGEWLRTEHTGHMISWSHHRTYRFDHRLSAFDLTALDWTERLDRAVTEKRI